MINRDLNTIPEPAPKFVREISNVNCRVPSNALLTVDPWLCSTSENIINAWIDRLYHPNCHNDSDLKRALNAAVTGRPKKYYKAVLSGLRLAQCLLP